jgi:hypothetical protein
LLIVLPWNLTKYEINLQNLTLFLAKPSFCLFDACIVGNKFGENMMEDSMKNKEFEKKPEPGGPTTCKRAHVA